MGQKSHSQTGTNYVQWLGVHIDSDPSTGQIREVKALKQNLSEMEVSEVDLSMELLTDTTIGHLSFAVQRSTFSLVLQ